MKQRERILFEGLVAGLIGYAGIALFFAVFNTVSGQSPFYTAGLLGDALFYGRQDPAGFTVAPGPVLAFNGVHLLFFIAVGMLVAVLAYEAERGPQFWYVATIVFAFVFIHVVGGFVWMTAPMRSAVPIWSIGVSATLAAIAVSAYVWWAHPRLHYGQQEDAIG